MHTFTCKICIIYLSFCFQTPLDIKTNLSAFNLYEGWGKPISFVYPTFLQKLDLNSNLECCQASIFPH